MKTKQKLNKTLQEKIDLLGELKEKVNELEKEIEIITNDLKTLPNGVYLGNSYMIDVSVRNNASYDVIQIAKKIGSNFFNVVNVIKKEVLKYMSESELEDCIKEVKEVKTLNVKRIK